MSDTESSLLAWLVVSSVLFLLVLYLFYPALVAAAAPVIRSEEVPLSSLSSANDKKDNKNDKPILLSLVIPAYNEELRLESMLREAYDYLMQKNCPALQVLSQSSSSYGGPCVVEFILVDDGSVDQTERVFQEFAAKAATSSTATTATQQQQRDKTAVFQFRLLRLHHNVGKGAAVQTGMLAARGAFCLMVDADGATAFEPGLEAVVAAAATHDFILGSRADLSGTGAAQRSPLRKLLQGAFHLLVVLLVGTSEIQDTQCGFKLFRGSIVPVLFGRLHLRRWAFDTELLYRAAGVHLKLKEVNVPWHEVEGSKLNTGPLALVQVAIQMLRDMLCVRLCYTLRIWKVPRRATKENTKDQ